MKKVLFLGITIALTACTQVSSVSKEDARSVEDQISYMRDARTDQCFATISSSTYYAYRVVSITSVPCTPLVLAQVRQ